MLATMTASERFRAFLSGKPVDRAPAIEWAPWWNLTVERWRSEGLPESCGDVESIQSFFGLDKCLQTCGWPRTAATPQPEKFGSGLLATEEDYERILPTLFPPPEQAVDVGRFDWIHTTHERGDTLHFFTVEGFFWFPRTLFGIERHLFSFYDQPALYLRICRDYLKWLEAVLPFVFERFRFDFMSFAEDMSYNNGPMISPELFEAFLAPCYRRIIPLVHSYGIPVFIDSDGDISLAVDWYASVGADGMFPLERQAGVDVATYLDKQPSMAFLGHFDKMCMKIGKDAMRAEFERLLPSVRRGKVIPSVDHQTPPDVSIDNYRAYVALLLEYAAKATHDSGAILPCPVFASAPAEPSNENHDYQ